MLGRKVAGSAEGGGKAGSPSLREASAEKGTPALLFDSLFLYWPFLTMGMGSHRGPGFGGKEQWG